MEQAATPRWAPGLWMSVKQSCVSSLQIKMRSGMSLWLARSSGSTCLLSRLACFDQVGYTHLQAMGTLLLETVHSSNPLLHEGVCFCRDLCYVWCRVTPTPACTCCCLVRSPSVTVFMQASCLYSGEHAEGLQQFLLCFCIMLVLKD